MLPADLVDKLTKLESAAVMPPELRARLAALEYAMVMPQALRDALDGLQAGLHQTAQQTPTAGIEGPFARSLRLRRQAEELGEQAERHARSEALAALRATRSEIATQREAMAALSGLRGERGRVAAALSAPCDSPEVEFRDYSAPVLQPAPGPVLQPAPAAVPAPAHHLPLSFPLLHHVQASAAAAPADGQQSHAAPAPAAGLHLVRPPSDAAKEQAGAVAALKPPQGFTKGGGWTDASRAELQRQYESLRTAGLTYEGAMIELHKAWGYSKKSDKSGGPLAKVLTRANQDASRNGKRRQLAG
ncbi:MAG: hypothetical protein ACK5Y7_11330 [Betaproteobacteria bacterium]|nr:hypothetical protein [Rubrivivax sp.]